IRERDDAAIQELHFVDRHHLRERIEPKRDLLGGIDRNRLDRAPVMRADGVHAAVAVVEMRLEHLHALLRDQRSAHAANEFLGLPAEHHAGDHLDPAAIQLKRARGHFSLRGGRPLSSRFGPRDGGADPRDEEDGPRDEDAGPRSTRAPRVKGRSPVFAGRSPRGGPPNERSPRGSPRGGPPNDRSPRGGPPNERSPRGGPLRSRSPRGFSRSKLRGARPSGAASAFFGSARAAFSSARSSSRPASFAVAASSAARSFRRNAAPGIWSPSCSASSGSSATISRAGSPAASTARSAFRLFSSRSRAARAARERSYGISTTPLVSWRSASI